MFIFAIILFSKSSFCEVPAQNNFPFTGVSLADNLNIRSGSNRNFPSIYKLKKDSKVIVKAEQYGWYKVNIPQDAIVYVARQYVQQKGISGFITNDNINIRIKPSGDSDVVGMLKKGDVVSIVLGQSSRHYIAIRPTLDTCGWVVKDYIKFESSYVIPKPIAVPSSVENIDNIPQIAPAPDIPSNN